VTIPCPSMPPIQLDPGYATATTPSTFDKYYYTYTYNYSYS